MLSPASSQPVTLATDLGVTGLQATPFTFLNPLAGAVQLSNITIDLFTSATVATRRLTVTVNDENGDRRLIMLAPGIQIANQNFLHPFVQGDKTVTGGGLTTQITIPRGFYMRKDWVIIFSSNFPASGDTQRIMFQLLR